MVMNEKGFGRKPLWRATCPEYLTLLDLITVIIFVEDYKLWSCSLFSFLLPPLTSSLVGPNVLPNTLFSSTLVLRKLPSLYELAYTSATTNYVYVTLSVFGLRRSREGELSERCDPEYPCDKWSDSCHRRTSVMTA
jgi:hypothetical protein